MKTTVLFLILLIYSICAIGQDATVVSDTVPKGRKNVVKFLPVNLAFNSIAFDFERKIGQKSSLVLGVGFPTSKPFPKRYNLTSPENDISEDALSTMSIRLDYRHYSGEHRQPKGFYASPYIKYQKINASAMVLVTPDMGPSYDEKIDAKINTLNLGFQMGCQWLIAKTVSIDFYFLGIEVGLANLDATVTSPNGEEIDTIYNEVKDQIDNMPAFWGDKLTVTKQGSNQVVVNGSSLPYPWLRSGISIGIAF